MYVLRHKILPYFLTWEGTEESFEELKSQIDMEMKENGIDGFTVKFISNNVLVGENDEPKKSRVMKPADKKRKGPRVGERVKRPPIKKPYNKKSGREDLQELPSRKVATKRKPPMKQVGKGLDSFVESKTQTASSEKKDA